MQILSDSQHKTSLTWSTAWCEESGLETLHKILPFHHKMETWDFYITLFTHKTPITANPLQAQQQDSDALELSLLSAFLKVLKCSL